MRVGKATSNPALARARLSFDLWRGGALRARREEPCRANQNLIAMTSPGVCEKSVARKAEPSAPPGPIRLILAFGDTIRLWPSRAGRQQILMTRERPEPLP
jgi:hypothetical protein